ncbi:tetratricopeptide repeat protein [Streptomyces axinellae]|uniref:Tetratricopeptide repeat protein n=1 Tax=Streptomyces axinellae TaxID=552788 RepID=A0ABN3QQW5_9ACTN
MTDQAVQPTAAATGPHAFTGRDRELRALREDIARAGLHTLSGHPLPHSRVLLIAGAPGSGRTALAEEFVRGIRDRYPGGVLRARLTDPGGLPVPTERTARDLLAALAALGTPPDAEPPLAPPPGADEEDLSHAVRTCLAGRGPTLLFLDDVADSEQLLDLLPDSRDCLVVAVAAGPLTGVPDVLPCALGGLDRATSVALLARRAGAAPRITVDPRSAEALAEACGDLPAALELMGGWMGARPKLSVHDAGRRLAACSDLPDPPEQSEPPGPPGEYDEADPPERQGHRKPLKVRTPTPLRHTFRLVNGSLSASSARMLRLLALAPAGFADPQTASALAGCSLTVAREALEEFVRLGLLRELGGECYEVPGCLDPLLRAELTAHERPGEAMLARARLLERLVRRLQACRAVCEPPGSEARGRMARMPRALRFAGREEARAWLAGRRSVLLAAARMTVAEGDGELDTLARRLVSALARAFDAHHEPAEAAPELYRLHELILTVARRGGLHRESATALLNLGDLDTEADRLEEALVRYRGALDEAREGKDEAATARALESLAGTYAELSDWARAADWYGRALELRLTRDERADREAAARLHGRIGAVHTHANQWEEALRAWRAAAAAFRRLREPGPHARALAEAARVQEWADHLSDALRTYGQALDAARAAGEVRLGAALRYRLAGVCERLGDLRGARAHRAAADTVRGVPPSPGPRESAAEPGPAGHLAGAYNTADTAPYDAEAYGAYDQEADADAHGHAPPRIPAPPHRSAPPPDPEGPEDAGREREQRVVAQAEAEAGSIEFGDTRS